MNPIDRHSLIWSTLNSFPISQFYNVKTIFYTKLSQNYIEILKDDEYYDITIEVGEDPNVKIFRAHMVILCYRSPYLQQILASNKKDNGNGNTLTNIKLPNILPETFQIILK